MSGSEIVDVALLRLDPGVPAPQYARDGDAGADLATTENVEIAPGERVLEREQHDVKDRHHGVWRERQPGRGDAGGLAHCRRGGDGGHWSAHVSPLTTF